MQVLSCASQLKMPMHKEYLNHTLGLTLSTPGLVYLYFSTYPNCCSHHPHEMHMAAGSLYDASCDSCRSCWLWCSISPLAAAPSPASHGLRCPGCCCLRLSAHKSFPGPGQPGLERPGPPGPGYPGRSEWAGAETDTELRHGERGERERVSAEWTLWLTPIWEL